MSGDKRWKSRSFFHFLLPRPSLLLLFFPTHLFFLLLEIPSCSSQIFFFPTRLTYSMSSSCNNIFFYGRKFRNVISSRIFVFFFLPSIFYSPFFIFCTPQHLSVIQALSITLEDLFSTFHFLVFTNVDSEPLFFLSYFQRMIDSPFFQLQYPTRSSSLSLPPYLY